MVITATGGALAASKVTFGDGNKDRHYIHWKSSWFNQGKTEGVDTILPGLDRDLLIALGYTKLKITISFQYRVDDWGTQLLQFFSPTDKELKYFKYEWKECGWTNKTETFTLNLSDLDGSCGFWMRWFLAADENGSDTWYVGGTTFTMTAVKE